MVAMTRRARVDDDDVFDDEGNGPYDKRYPGRRVIADKGRVRVPIQLTDAMPPEYRAAVSRRPMLFDASAHRPHYAVVDASDPHVRAAAEARQAWIRGLRDAYRTPPSGQMQDPPDNGADDDDDPEALAASARNDYISNISNAWRARGPYAWAAPGPNMLGPQPSPGNPGAGGNGNGAAAPNAIEAQRQSWIRPGASAGNGGDRRSPPGVSHGQHDPGAFPSQDAASIARGRALADAEYEAYCSRIREAWRT